MNKIVQVGLLGFGTVGSGVVQIFQNNAALMARKTGTDLKIKKILVRDLQKKRPLVAEAELTTDPDSILNDPEIQIIIELMGGEEQALNLMLAALKKGKHVVTANKDVIARHGRELFAAAEANNVNLLFEASVGGGIPIIRPLKRCLAARARDLDHESCLFI